MPKTFDPTPDTSAAPTAVAAKQKPKKPAHEKNSGKITASVLPEIPTVNIPVELDLRALSPGYMAMHIPEVSLDTVPQRLASKLLTESLVAKQAELADGSRVQRADDAVKWLLEQMIAGIPIKIFDDLTSKTGQQ